MYKVCGPYMHARRTIVHGSKPGYNVRCSTKKGLRTPNQRGKDSHLDKHGSDLDKDTA